MRSLLRASCAVLPLLLASCAAINTTVVDPLLTDLSKINNTAIADLQQAIKVADAATPPDVDGASCAQSAITVGGQINAVFAAANNGGSATGPLTLAELASLFQPGSIQYDQAKQTLTSGCAAKAQDVLGAAGVLAAGGVVGAIAAGSILPTLAAAAP